jgi:hypothetical protein
VHSLFVAERFHGGFMIAIAGSAGLLHIFPLKRPEWRDSLFSISFVLQTASPAKQMRERLFANPSQNAIAFSR